MIIKVDEEIIAAIDEIKRKHGAEEMWSLPNVGDKISRVLIIWFRNNDHLQLFSDYHQDSKFTTWLKENKPECLL